MCLLGISFQNLPHCPLLVFANREEAYSRPSTGPLLHPSRGGFAAWVGGVDLDAGGTWLGINAHGLLAAVTNRRRHAVPLQPRSRGLLCRSLLAHRSVQEGVSSAVEQLRKAPFAGCNLLIASRNEATVIEFSDELNVTTLSAGLHVITNSVLNDPNDHRIARVRRTLEAIAPNDPAAWSNAARTICTLRRNENEPDIWLEGSERGTVSSTVLTLADRPNESHYWHTSRDESSIAFTDHAPLLRGMVTGGMNVGGAHRIQLRGPWRIEPLARVETGPEGSTDWSSHDLPPWSAAQLPDSLANLLEGFRGRIAFRRRFHRPNNLESHERVEIVLEGVVAAGHVSLNGRPLGPIDTRMHSFRSDVTDRLEANNQLAVDLEITQQRFSQPMETQPWQLAYLEIRARDA